MDGKRQKDVSKAFMAETFNSVLLPFFPPLILKVDVQSRSRLTWVQNIMSRASKQAIVLWREPRSCSAPKPSEAGMGAVKVGWRCSCGPADWDDGDWGWWPGLLPLPCRCPSDCAAPPPPVFPPWLWGQALGQEGSCLREPSGQWYRQHLSICSLNFSLFPFTCGFPELSLGSQWIDWEVNINLRVYKQIPEDKGLFPFIIHIIYLTWIKTGTLQSNTQFAELNTTLKDL